MLIFDSSYDDFMILSYDKVWSQISSHKIYLFKLWLRHSLRVFMFGGQWKCFISLNFFSWPSFIILRLRNDLYCVEWVVKLYSLTHSLIRRSLYKQQVFSTCDWLLFLFTIITLRSLMTNLRRSYDDFTIVNSS